MKRNTVLIILAIVAAVVAYVVLFRRKAGSQAAAATSETQPDCPVINTLRFPKRWQEYKIPHGDLRGIADRYLTPVIGGDPEQNAATLGGFFKAIDTFPSMAAADYYQPQLLKWAASTEAAPFWEVAAGQSICLN